MTTFSFFTENLPWQPLVTIDHFHLILCSTEETKTVGGFKRNEGDWMDVFEISGAFKTNPPLKVM